MRTVYSHINGTAVSTATEIMALSSMFENERHTCCKSRVIHAASQEFRAAVVHPKILERLGSCCINVLL